MQLLAWLAWLAVAAALARRWRRAQPTSARLETGVIATASTLALAGLTGVALGMLQLYSSHALALTGFILATSLWPWRSPPPRETVPRGSHRPAIAIAIALLVGVALRIPLHSAALAGRDQGTYVLRAQHLLRTGGFAATDTTLAAAGRTPERPGALDLLGLYPTDQEPWRRGIYEGAYRPGLYLTQRARGTIVPQFLHTHPTLLAFGGVLGGPGRLTWILHLYSALSILAVAAIARRLWPTQSWTGPLAAAALALMPLAVWVQRTPLTEALVLPLGLAALLAALASDRRWIAAILLASLAWIRGNAWLAAPLVLAILWLRPRTTYRSVAAPLLYGAVLAGSLILHATSVFPYLYDEFQRQLGGLVVVRPTTLIVLPLAGLLLWTAVDAALGRLRPDVKERLAGQLPRVLVLASFAAILTFLFGQPTPLGRPFSRLDPALAALGLPLLAAAAWGALQVLRRPPEANVWTLAIASVPVTTLALYAQRNLPQAGLFYYGRYLLPELVPLAIFLAIHGVVDLTDRVERSPRLAASTLGRALRISLPLALVAAIALPWLTQPVIRAHEHAGSERVVTAIADALPDDATVIAGGEGWHSSHAYNQVGGALMLGHGINVLPFRSAEVAYATLHALLVETPLAGDPPAPVFLLLGEASHAYTRDDGALIAAIDDRLPAPFHARPIGLYELYTDRLTPTVEALPERVTRAALRLGLFAVEVDPALQRTIHSWRLRDAAAQGEPGEHLDLTLKHARWSEGSLCLDPKRALEITLPTQLRSASVVLVGRTGRMGTSTGWSVRAGKRKIDISSRGHTQERETLGPYPLSFKDDAPPRLYIRGDKTTKGTGTCPHGQLSQLRLLPTSAQGEVSSPIDAQTFSPPHDLGHTPKAARWVRGRSLSRLRPGITPKPKLDGQSIVLRPDAPLRFPPTEFPAGPGVWIVHLTKIHATSSLELRVDGRLLRTIDLPEGPRGSWQAPPIPWTAGASPASLEITARGGEEASVSLRDVAFFSDAIISAPRP